ncbi:MAG: MFS transporter [Planctomycetaceae bacterium]|nr:MFS transporter [Planctomycetaceae bacterium]
MPNAEPARKSAPLFPVDTIVLYFLMMTYAVSTTIIGSILLQLLDEFGLPVARGGIFYSVLNTGCFFGILASGVLIDRYRPARLNLVTYVGFSLLLLVVTLTRGLTAYLATVLVIGMVSKLMDASINACIAAKHTVNKGFYMNLLHGSFGIGSFCGPLLGSSMLEHGYSWRAPYLLLGIFCLAIGGAYWLFSRRDTVGGRVAAAPPAPFRSVLKPDVILLVVILILYCGHQMGMNNWVPAYLQERFGTADMLSGFGLSMFWLGLIVSRVGCSFLTTRYPERQLLQAGMALGAVFLIACVLLDSEWAAFAGSTAAGLFTGATIPMVLTLGYSWHPDARGTMTMLCFAAITVGGVIFPWLMGVVGEAWGLNRAMLLNGGLLAVAFFLTLALPAREG